MEKKTVTKGYQYFLNGRKPYLNIISKKKKSKPRRFFKNKELASNNRDLGY
jgi:hypothetical protein